MRIDAFDRDLIDPALCQSRKESLVLPPLAAERGLPFDVGGDTSTLSQLLEVLHSDPESVAQRLNPIFRVATCFNNESLRENHLHLLVQAPIFRDGETTGAKKRKRNLAGDIADFRDGED